MPEKRILVSACLVGWNTRYNGASQYSAELMKKALEEGWSIVPICPEVLGGLAIPRESANIVGGDGGDVVEGRARVVTASGKDVTGAFILGARRSLDVALATGCKCAIFKENSPSCGVRAIKDRGGNKRDGVGVATAMLMKSGISIESQP